MLERIKTQTHECIHEFGFLFVLTLFSSYRLKKKDTKGVFDFLHLSLWGGINVICLKSFFEQTNNNIPPACIQLQLY